MLSGPHLYMPVVVPDDGQRRLGERHLHIARQASAGAMQQVGRRLPCPIPVHEQADKRQQHRCCSPSRVAPQPGGVAFSPPRRCSTYGGEVGRPALEPIFGQRVAQLEEHLGLHAVKCLLAMNLAGDDQLRPPGQRQPAFHLLPQQPLNVISVLNHPHTRYMLYYNTTPSSSLSATRTFLSACDSLFRTVCFASLYRFSSSSLVSSSILDPTNIARSAGVSVSQACSISCFSSAFRSSLSARSSAGRSSYPSSGTFLCRSASRNRCRALFFATRIIQK